MKKLLVLLALCMIICVAFVACNDEQNPDETTAGTTEAPTTQAPTTEAPTTEAPTTEEPTTETPTTEEPTTETPTTEEPTIEDPTTEGTNPDDPDTIADNTNTFKSDVTVNEVGAAFDATDLNNIMIVRPGNSQWSVVEENGAKLYAMTGIDAVTADMNGAYYFKTNIAFCNNGSGIGAVVRGYNSTVSSDKNVEYEVTNFYETDGAGFCGGSGIYAYLHNGKLAIVVKQYDSANGTRVANKLYSIAAEGSELVMADNGSVVSIMLNGVTYATIELSGSVTYEDITTTPEGAFAAKAVVTLKDGTTETLENTLVAATVNSQVGVVCRGSQFKFSEVEAGGYSAIEVPALEIVEPEPVDPLAPVLVITPEYIASVAPSGNNIASAVVSEDGTFVTITTKAGDPNFTLFMNGMYTGIKYITLCYRTTDAAAGNGQFFVGSGGAPIGNGTDSPTVTYTADGEWHVFTLDLSTVAAVNAEGLVNYLRHDVYGDAASTMDVQYIALFNSIESYNKFYGIEEEPEQPEQPPVENVFQGNWHCSVDAYVGDGDGDLGAWTSGDYSAIDTLILGAATNKTNGITLATGEATYASLEANYIWFGQGWIAVDGYDVENLACNVYDAEGNLLKTVALSLPEADVDVVNHVSQGMGYGEGTVSHRICVYNTEEMVNLTEYAGQTVTVVYSVGVVGTEYTLELVKVDVAVPAAAAEPEVPAES